MPGGAQHPDVRQQRKYTAGKYAVDMSGTRDKAIDKVEVNVVFKVLV